MIFYAASCSKRNPKNNKMTGIDEEFFALHQAMWYVIDNTRQLKEEDFAFHTIYKYDSDQHDRNGICEVINWDKDESEIYEKFNDLLYSLKKFKGLTWVGELECYQENF
jgi:hypothetical protein